MRKLVLSMLFALAAFTTAGQMASAQKAETMWAHPGADPYASSPEEARAKLHVALIALKVPEAARPLLEAAVKAKPEGESIDYITPATDKFTFKAMMRTPDGQVLFNAPLRAIPIKLKGKDGKLMDGMFLTAKARVWRVEFEGRIIVLYDPLICNNWAWREEAAPKEVTPGPCYELRVPTVHAGDRVTLQVRADGHTAPLPLCLPKKPAEWDSLPDCLNCFLAKGPLVFSVPAEVAEHYEIMVCWKHKGKSSLQGVVTPNSWVDGKFEVPDLETIEPIPKG